MGIIKRLFRKEEVEEKPKEEVEEKPKLTELEQICLNDSEVYEALKDTMFLNPLRIDVSFDDAVSNARKFEKEKNYLKAALWYKIAGGLAIYKGDVNKVREYFGKYAKLTGKKLKILEAAEEAVKKAQEYYQRYLKEK